MPSAARGARLVRSARTAAPLHEAAARAAQRVGCDVWPPDAAPHALTADEAQARLEALVLEGTTRADLADDLRAVARALAATLGDRGAAWWPLAGPAGAGAVVAGADVVWGVWVETAAHRRAKPPV